MSDDTVKCTVVGLCAVYGVDPGGDVDVPASEVERLVNGGHVTTKSAKRNKSGASTTTEPATPADEGE